MSLIDIKPVGHDSDCPSCILYEETHKCDRCGAIWSFSYYHAYDLETTKRVAEDKLRARRLGGYGKIKEDLCWKCKEVEVAKERREKEQRGLEGYI